MSGHAERPRKERGASRRAWVVLALTLMLVLAVTLLTGLTGCGSEPAVEETPEFEELLVEAEAGVSNPEDPASFISLCANCHDRLDRELDWRHERKLIFNHPAHFAKGIRCAACHQEFPHKPGKIIYVSVETCFTCHGTSHGEQGMLAPSECDVCHTPDIAPVTVDHKQESWVRFEGEGLGLHSRSAKESRLYCKMCHEQTFCDSCHQTEIPHGEDWVEAAHRTEAPEKRDACMMCHESKQFCNSCHHSSYPTLADWGLQHKAVPLSQGAESCFGCHEPPMCSQCHVATSKQRGVLGG
jgi:hypothetical protein